MPTKPVVTAAGDVLTVTTGEIITQTNKSISIGRPINNTQLYILNKQLKPVLVGKKGELYITGNGLARGYFDRPDLTAEKFIPNPFITDEEMKKRINLRLYKTGDVGCYLPDGSIELMGRIDDQIKIRGYRVELGEIEFILNTHKDVDYAVVKYCQDKNDNKNLVAYIVSNKYFNSDSFIDQLVNMMNKKLPKYMIPAFFMYIRKIPLTANGKLDRNALPYPKNKLEHVDVRLDIPTTKLEKKLFFIWKEVLKLNHLGTSDGFFRVGGHSLSAMQIITRIKESFNINISMRSFFENATITSLAKLIRSLIKKQEHLRIVNITISKKPKNIMLSFSQQRLLVLDKLSPGIPLVSLHLLSNYKDF